MLHPAKTACFTVMLVLMLTTASSAQQLKGGFEVVAKAEVGGEELLSQPYLWVYETQLKKMRMLRLETQDPETGKTSSNLYWYLVFKVVNRDLNRPPVDPDSVPQNANDPQPPEMFIPEILLVTNDENGPQAYPDVIIPEVQAEIARREELDLKNPVQLVGATMPTAKAGADTPAQYGVAIWKDVDPRTDFFAVFLSGFSNGYRIGEDPNGQSVRFRKTIFQEFWRPGDEKDENEGEMRFKGEPAWIYRIDAPRPVSLPIAEPSEVTAP